LRSAEANASSDVGTHFGIQDERVNEGSQLVAALKTEKQKLLTIWAGTADILSRSTNRDNKISNGTPVSQTQKEEQTRNINFAVSGNPTASKSVTHKPSDQNDDLRK
jgi:hypothetical protein